MKRHQQKRMVRLEQRRHRYRKRLLGHHRRWEALAAWFDPLIDPSRLAFAEGHFPAKGLRTQLYVVCAMEQLFNRDLVRALHGYSDAFKAALYTFDQPLFPSAMEPGTEEVECPTCGGSGDGRFVDQETLEHEPCETCTGYGSVPAHVAAKLAVSAPA